MPALIKRYSFGRQRIRLSFWDYDYGWTVEEPSGFFLFWAYMFEIMGRAVARLYGARGNVPVWMVRRRDESRLYGGGDVFWFMLIVWVSVNACYFGGNDGELPPPPPYRGVYHWQTELQLTPAERQWLDSLEIDRLYVKFFDLDWDPAAAEVVPLADVQIDTAGLGEREIIPTVFITNRSMLQIDTADIPLLALRITQRIDHAYDLFNNALPEVQVDCDWSPGSRERYFYLLEQLKGIYAPRGIKLSVTIRLHQLRYPDQTGVPPADRGVLMLYNMGDLEDWKEENSILNLETTRTYLQRQAPYDLPMDIALPLFRWAVLFREERMIKLINEPDEEILTSSNLFLSLGDDRYEVLQSTYLQGYYLYRGDRLRLERVRPEALRSLLEMLHTEPYPQWDNIILYHLDTTVVRRYGWSELRPLYEEPQPSSDTRR